MKELFDINSRHSRLVLSLTAMMVFVGALAFFASSLNQKPFYTRGESREALVVRAMFDQHDLITPMRNGDTVPSKPPLFHWMAYGTVVTIGEMSEFAIRFPSALCAALLLGATFLFVAREKGICPAANTTAILMTAFEFGRSATHARVDSCFALWLALGTFSLYQVAKTWLEVQAVSWPWLLAAVVSSALAVLAKGPAGLLLPWIVFGTYLFIVERKGPIGFLRSIPLWPLVGAFALALALSSLWYFATYLQEGAKFLQVQLFKENLTRLVEVHGESRGHVRPFYYTPVLLFVGFMPWSLLLPMAAIWIWQIRSQLRNADRAIELFAVVWLAVYLIVVTVSISKRSVYILPAYPAVAFLIAASLERLRFDLKSWKRSRIAIAYVLIMAACLPALILLLALGVHFVGIDAALAQLAFLKPKILLDIKDAVSVIAFSPLFLCCCLLTTILWLYGSRLVRRLELRNLVWASGGGVLLLFFAIELKITPNISERRTAREFMKEVELAVPRDKRLFRFEQDFYSAIYYSGNNLPRLKTIEEVFRVGDDGELYVLVREDKFEEISKKIASAEVILTSDSFAADGQAKVHLVRAFAPHSSAGT